MKVGSMFAGIGGIDLAFQNAGFDIVWANEIDKFACKTYRENFDKEFLIEGDIKQIDINTIPYFDVLTAGFPCQPFSIAGRKKGFEDERGQLFYQVERVVSKVKPRVIFLENVSNLEIHDNGKSFNKVFASIAQFGYIVRYKVMKASDYCDIPQNRDRIYIVAFRDYEDSLKFNFPEEVKTNKPLNEFIDYSKHDDSYYYNEKDKLYSLLLKSVTEKNRIYKIKDNGIFAFTKNMCPTLTANMGTFPNRVPIIKDDYGVRKLTPYELLGLQGFPKSYRFPKGIGLNNAYKQIGNSVCVPVIQRIAKEIKKVIQN